jgi:hypothetical protein
MKALSLWQPWASLMALGLKRIETRGWYMRHRGPLVIASTKTWNRDVLKAMHDANRPSCIEDESDWRRMIDRLLSRGVKTLGDLPLGAALCIVNVVDCVPTNEAIMTVGEDERAFGDYRLGRWAIFTELVRTFEKPVPCRGSQGLWEFDEGEER